ncbi:MAG: hypothetical protein ACLQU1_00115 [Bryobacteraceae bacterium]
MLRVSLTSTAVAALVCATFLFGADPDRDFSGKWVLDAPASDGRVMRPMPAESLSVIQTATAVECASAAAQWSYVLDGGERKAHFGNETWTSAAKWEGAALLIDTLVSGPENYTVMDRWELSRNHALLMVTRQVVRGGSMTEAQFYYRREGAVAAAPENAPAPGTRPAQGLVRRPEPSPDAEFVVPTGTHVLLELVNRLDAKHSKEGDRVYLRTAFPVYASNRLVIPQGASVLGTVTQAKKPGKTSGKGELYIRFDSLTLPNGVTRDFLSRLGSANGAQGDVDRDEGKITSPGNTANETRAAVQGGGMGAAIGGLAGSAAGHPITGLGIGGAAGAAAGLATVLAKGRPDAVLPKGTNVEMILDRDLRYRFDELR